MRAFRYPLVAVLAVVCAAACQSSPSRPDEPPDIDVKRVAEHLDELENIAENNDGNRAAGTSGYTESAEYITSTLEEAGYEVEQQECEDCTDPQDVNIIAEFAGYAKSDVDTIMFGAHLDSVAEGPGVNDNGSGAAVLLEVAQTLVETQPDMYAAVRFAWWAEEEAGMVGSSYYVDNTDTSDLEVYINLDMVASVNPGYFVTNMDTKYGKAYADYLASVGVKAEEAEADCDCSDDQPFADDDVPTVYVNTGDEVEMTSEQAERWDGEAGEVFDPCYHAACDIFPENIDGDALNHHADATAHIVWIHGVLP